MKVDKIQIKRGLKADLPNLDIGELGYCTDTKELYIGRGTNLTPNLVGAYDDTALRNLINTLSNSLNTVKTQVSTNKTDISNLKTGKVNIVTCTSLPSTTAANTWYFKIVNSGTNNDIEIYDSNKKLYRPKTDASLVSYGSTTVQSILGNLDKESSPVVNATGSRGAYTGSTSRITSLTKGTHLILFVNTDTSGSNCTFNLNSYGIKNIKDSFGNIITNMKANIPYHLCYNGTDFILSGKGGGGNLKSEYLLEGYYGEGNAGRVNGAMPNKGAVTSSLNAGGSYTIPKGYHNGSGKVTANSLASQTSATAGAGDMLSGKTAYVNGTKVTGNIPDRGSLQTSEDVVSYNNYLYFRSIPSGYYHDTTNSTSYYPEINASFANVAKALGITAGKIAKGQTICGVAGSYNGEYPYKQAKTAWRDNGRYGDGKNYGMSMNVDVYSPFDSSRKMTRYSDFRSAFIKGVGFVPRIIIVHVEDESNGYYGCCTYINGWWHNSVRYKSSDGKQLGAGGSARMSELKAPAWGGSTWRPIQMTNDLLEIPIPSTVQECSANAIYTVELFK